MIISYNKSLNRIDLDGEHRIMAMDNKAPFITFDKSMGEAGFKADIRNFNIKTLDFKTLDELGKTKEKNKNKNKKLMVLTIVLKIALSLEFLKAIGRNHNYKRRL